METLKIQKTADYTQFKRIKGNRQPNQGHVNKLIQAISTNPRSIEYTPIIVNEKNEVIDGHHRLRADEALELPVHYLQVKGLTLKDVQGLNSINKPWTPTDFAKAFGLNHDILLSFLGLEKVISTVGFKAGGLIVKDPQRSHDLCQKLIEMGQYYDGVKRRSFALAFKTAWMNPDYDHKHMLGRMKLKGSEIQDWSVPEDYLREMEAIYNGSSRNGDRIRFF
jgi:hypothetical protein